MNWYKLTFQSTIIPKIFSAFQIVSIESARCSIYSRFIIVAEKFGSADEQCVNRNWTGVQFILIKKYYIY